MVKGQDKVQGFTQKPPHKQTLVDRAPSHTCRRSQAILGNMYRAPQLGIEMEQRLQVLRFCSA